MPVESPDRKVTAAGLGGALTILVMWGFRLAGVEPPAEVGAALATVLAFAAGYVVKS